MATTRPRGRPRDRALVARRREEILSVATAIFAAEGYRRTDVQRIADAVGVGKGTVYRYFATKEDLFLAAVDRGIRALIDYVHHKADTLEDPLDRIRVGVRAYMEYFEAHPELPELFILERAEFKGRHKSLYFDYPEEDARWCALLEELVSEGRLRNIGADAMLHVIGELLYGSMLTQFLAGRDRPIDLQVAQILQVVFFGILTDRERARLAAVGGMEPPPSAVSGGTDREP